MIDFEEIRDTSPLSLKKLNDQMRMLWFKTKNITSKDIRVNAIESKHIQAGAIEAVHIKAGELIVGSNVGVADGALSVGNNVGIVDGYLSVGRNVELGIAQDETGVVTIINGTVTADYINALQVTARRLTTVLNGYVLADLYKDSYGGILELYDEYENLNVKIGVESGTGDNVGGTLVLYNDSSGKPRVELGISLNYGGAVANFKNNSGYVTAAIYGSSNYGYGGVLMLADRYGGQNILLDGNDGSIICNGDIDVDNINCDTIYLDKVDFGSGNYISSDSSNSIALNTPITYCSDLYAGGDIIYTGSLIDGTPFYEGDALSEIKRIKGKNGQLDHSTLPEFARKKIKKRNKKLVKDSKGIEKTTIDGEEIEGRDIGAMVSILTVGMQQLIEKIEKLEDKINKMEGNQYA